jgi:hypothetical protein
MDIKLGLSLKEECGLECWRTGCLQGYLDVGRLIGYSTEFCNEKSHELYLSPHITMIKSRKMRWAE